MMAQDMEGAVERSEGTPVRDSVVAAVGALRESPNVTSAVNAGIADRDREIRNRDRDRAKPLDRYQLEADQRDRRNSATRNAVHEVTRQASSSTPKLINGTEVSIGPPPTWSTQDKQHWDTLPESAQLAVLSDHSQIKPHLQRLSEIDRVIAPSRAVFQQYGCRSDAEAVQRLFEWEHSLRVDPHQGIQRLAHQLGVDLRQLVGYQQQYDPVAQQPNYSPEEAQAVEQHLVHFAQSHPHYEQVRVAMGLLLHTRGDQFMSGDGSFDLEKVYETATRNLGVGVGDNRSRRIANVSPRGRAPAMHAAPEHRGGSSVRNSLKAAIEQIRG